MQPKASNPVAGSSQPNMSQARPTSSHPTVQSHVPPAPVVKSPVSGPPMTSAVNTSPYQPTVSAQQSHSTLAAPPTTTTPSGQNDLRIIFVTPGTSAEPAVVRATDTPSSVSRSTSFPSSEDSQNVLAPVQYAQAPWSPDRAVRSRLAMDIMRSLGRPKGNYGDPFSPPDTAPRANAAPQPGSTVPPVGTASGSGPMTSPTPQGQPTATVAPAGLANLKRKASLVPRSPTPLKRLRQESEQTEPSLEPTGRATPSPASTDVRREMSLPVKSGEATPKPGPQEPEAVGHVDTDFDIAMDVVPTPEDLEGDSQAAPVVPSSPEPLLVVRVADLADSHEEDRSPVRAASITSSEAMDVDRVQAMFAAPQSDASSATSPPTAVTSSPYVSDTANAASITSHVTNDPIPGPATSPSPPPPPELPPPAAPPVSVSSVVKEKVPLFLPSPSTSTGASPPPHTLPSRKGKERAIEVDAPVDEAGLDDEPSRSSTHSSGARRQKAYVLVPPPPTYATRLLAKLNPSRGSNRGGPSRAPSSHSSVDELAGWHGASPVGSTCHIAHNRSLITAEEDRLEQGACPNCALWAPPPCGDRL